MITRKTDEPIQIIKASELKCWRMVMHSNSVNLGHIQNENRSSSRDIKRDEAIGPDMNVLKHHAR